MPGLAVFDVDGTLVRGDCGVIFVLWCARRFLLRPGELWSFALWGAKAASGRVGEPEVAEAKRLLLRLRLRFGDERFAALYEACFAREILPRLDESAAAELRLRAAAGEVFLVTANLREFAVRLGRELGVPEARCLGAEGERRAGALTGELAGPVPMLEERARLVRSLLADAGVPAGEASAYGDSLHDVPMLREVGRPCAVRPSGALRALAAREGWRILD